MRRLPAIPFLTILLSAVPLVAQNGIGLRGEYFNSQDLTGPVKLVRTDGAVNFEWSRSPAVGVEDDEFSVRWTGQILAPATAAYTFTTVSNNGVRLWVNNSLVIDNWTTHSTATDHSAPVPLTAGQKYDVRMEFFERYGGAVAKLQWNAPSQPAVVIPQSQLFPPATTYLSDLDWASATNGEGPVSRDRSNGGSGASDGVTLAINGIKYGKGLGVRAPSDIHYNLAGKYDVFTASIGIDDEVTSTLGSAVFQVYLDGVKAYQSETLHGYHSARFVRLIVSGKNDLRLVVTTGGDSGTGDHADWADAQLAKGGVTLDPYLSDLDWTHAANGWGPVERDKSNGEANAADGVPMSINGMKFTKGLGVHAASDVRFNLDKQYASFVTWIGIDDEVGSRGSGTFQVWLDGVKAYESPQLSGNSDPVKVTLSVGGKSELRLVMSGGGDGNSNDHADWAGAQLFHSTVVTPAVTPPAAPTNLTATPGNTQVVLSWTAPAGAVTYSVYRGTSAGGEASTPIATGLTSPAFTNSGLTNGTKYFFKVTAVNGGGASARSNEASAMPVPGAPPAPTNLKATPGEAKITLSWSSSAGATSYSIFRGATAGGEAATAIATGITGTNYVNTGLTNGTKYFYKVAAVNLGGTGMMSNEASGVPVPPAPGTPGSLTAVPGDSKVILSWQASTGAATYSVFRGSASGAESTTAIATGLTVTTFTNTGLTNGTKYFYKVQAVNLGGASSLSNEAAATPAPPVPAAPTGLTATGGDTKISLAWTASPTALSYSVFRGTAANGESSTAIASGLTALTFSDTGLTNGKKYFYKVTAVNLGGSSPLSNEASATPLPPLAPAPTGLTATPADRKITLAWSASTGAVSYSIFRGPAANGESSTAIATGITALTYNDLNLTNGTAYFYKIAAVNLAGPSPLSAEASATPKPPVPSAPTNLKAKPGDTTMVLTWSSASGATSYNIYRGVTAGGESASPVATGITTATFTDTGLANGIAMFYKVAGVNLGGTGAMSNEATATPVPPVPAAPAGLSATAGNAKAVLAWTATAGAASYNIYRGSTVNGESATPIATGITATTFTDSPLPNGPTVYYKISAVNLGGISPRSAEVSATPLAPPAVPSAAFISASRLLRQSTWGPTPTLVDHVMQVGASAFLDEQFNAIPSDYPDALKTQGSIEPLQERFFQNALTGQDQLRQRVAFALSQIFVVSGVKVTDPRAMVTYQKMLLNNAFGNYYDVLRAVTLDPAMGEFLDMVNNRKFDPARGFSPNENYAREVLQLFSIGLAMLNPDGTNVLVSGATVPTYDQTTISELARVFTGWTYGDNKAGQPTGQNPVYYDGPMEAVEKYHDTGAKTVLGTLIPAGQTTTQDLDSALRIIFQHQNVGPFIVKNLIQHLVTSNPSAAYVQRVSAVFANNGVGVRGDLKAVVKAILLDSEAALGQTGSGHLREPAVYLSSMLRALNATVADHPFVSDKSEEMGERIYYAPSVFNYYSPGFRTAAGQPGPEYQIFTTATALVRINFVSTLLNGGFGSDVTLDFAPYLADLPNTGAMLDRVNFNFMGGLMSQAMRDSIMAAVAKANSNREKVQTAIYLAVTSSQYQVEN